MEITKLKGRKMSIGMNSINRRMHGYTTKSSGRDVKLTNRNLKHMS
jgi:hypothetical protein